MGAVEEISEWQVDGRAWTGLRCYTVGGASLKACGRRR